MNCKHYQREIEHIELSGSFSHKAQKHIESCATCRTFKREHDSLRYMIGGLEKVKAPANFDTRLRARIAASKQQKSHGFLFFQPTFVRPALTLGLVLGLVLAGFLLIRPFSASNQPLENLADLPSFSPDWINENDFSRLKDEPQDKDEVKPVVKNRVRHFTAYNKSKREEVQTNELGNSPVRETTLPLGFDSEASITIPVKRDSRSFVINDKRVSLRLVTFGSQAMIEGHHLARPVYASNTERVW